GGGAGGDRRPYRSDQGPRARGGGAEADGGQVRRFRQPRRSRQGLQIAAMTALRAWVAAAALLLVAGGAASETLDFTRPEPGEAEPGGAATTHAPRNTSVFSQPSANMHFQRQIDFKVGDG